MTNAIVTPRQVQANCPEDPNIPGVICTDDPSVCQYGVRDMLGNGRGIELNFYLYVND